MKVRDVVARLRRDGWRQVRARGNHRQFAHPDRPGRVTVPGNWNHELPVGTLRSIEKQAGWRP